MSRSAFMDRNCPPRPDEVHEKLGRRCNLWEMFQDYLQENEPLFVQKWVYQNQKMGWVLNVRQGETLLASLVPCSGSMRFSFYFANQVMEAIEREGLHPEFEKMVRGSKASRDGKTFEFEARRVEDLEVARQIIELRRQFI